jgi:hypothetical protein
MKNRFGDTMTSEGRIDHAPSKLVGARVRRVVLPVGARHGNK